MRIAGYENPSDETAPVQSRAAPGLRGHIREGNRRITRTPSAIAPPLRGSPLAWPEPTSWSSPRAPSRLGLVMLAGGTSTAVEMARRYPSSTCSRRTRSPTCPSPRAVIEKYLKAGAIMIGEQKFRVECDSPESQALYALAAEYRVPILLHFQHGAYNLGFDRFHTMLEKYPQTVFIGHAQTWWANIDRQHADQKSSTRRVG